MHTQRPLLGYGLSLSRRHHLNRLLPAREQCLIRTGKPHEGYGILKLEI